MKIRAILAAAALMLGTLGASAQDASKTTSGGTTPATATTQSTTATTTTAAPAQTSASGQTAAKQGTAATAPKTTAPRTTATASEKAAADKKAADAKAGEAKPETPKPGSKNDVEAIGNRNVGSGTGMGNWYSLEKEIRMGKEYAQQIEQSVKLVQDPVVNEYVNRIGQNLVRNSDAKVPFTIKVIDDDSINAMALPGGFFYVNSGLILAADEEAELAGVMAHEIAHVAARHATRQMTRGQWANIASLPLIFVGGGLGYGLRTAAGFGLPMGFMAFSRSFEAEADYLGLQYMYKAGYDPQSFVNFFEKVEAKEKKKPGTLAKAFSSHPQTPDRIEKSQEEITRILPGKPQYMVSSSEFDEVKARLAALENRRKVVDDKENKPTLRRSTADSSKSGDKDSKKDDDRPTLKRRD